MAFPKTCHGVERPRAAQNQPNNLPCPGQGNQCRTQGMVPQRQGWPLILEMPPAYARCRALEPLLQ